MDMNPDFYWAPLAFAIVGICIAGVAALAAVFSVRHAAFANVTNAFLNLRDKYHTDDMRKAIETLVGFAVPVKENIIDQWNKKLRAGDFRAIGMSLNNELNRMSPEDRNKILSAVRRVAAFFDDVGFLSKHKIITDRSIVRSFINVPGINIYYEVCAPVHAFRNPQSPSIEYARLLRGIVKQYGQGMSKY